MKKYTLLLILSLSFMFCKAQKLKPSSFDIVGGIGQSFRTLKFDDSDTSLVNVNSSRSREEAIVSYKLGVNSHFNIRPHLYLKLGVLYSTSGSQRKLGELWSRTDLIELSKLPESAGASFTNASWRFTDYFFDFPINLGYIHRKKRFQPFIEMGLTLRYYLGTASSFNSDTYNSSEWIQYDFNKTQWAINGSAGFLVNLKNNYAVFAQLNHLRNITSLKTALILEFPYSTFIEIGFRKQLEK